MLICITLCSKSKELSDFLLNTQSFYVKFFSNYKLIGHDSQFGNQIVAISVYLGLWSYCIKFDHNVI